MRGLVEHGAAAARGVELLRPARTVKVVGEVERGDHAQLAELPAFYQFPRTSYRGIKTVTMTHHELHTRLARRVDHAPALLEAERHRLLDQDVLAVLRREAGMLGVELVGRGDIDDVDVGGAAQSFDRLEESALEGGFPRIRRARELDPRVGEGGRHHLERPSEPGHPYSEPAHAGKII